MTEIARSMKKKGYTPLAADDKGGIGFRDSVSKENGLLEKPVWFDTGKKMKDAKGKFVPRTVSAADELKYAEYIEKGWTPVIQKKVKSKAKKAEGKK
jgi:hypothetical protein